MVKLIHLGRAIAIQPASFGSMYEAMATLTLIEQVPGSPENNWVRGRKEVANKLFWYTPEPESAFVTYSGFTRRIEEDLASKGIPVDHEYRTDHGLPDPDLTKISHVTWRPGQLDVFSAMLAHPRGVIVCPTAFGKTFMVKLLAMVYPTSKIVITVPVLDVARDIYNDLKDEISDVGFHGTGKHKDGRVTVCVSRSLVYAPADANLVIVDEAHSILTFDYITMLNRFYRAKLFGLTASPTGRGDGGDGYLNAIFGHQLADVTYQQGVAAGNIVQLKVRMIRITKGPDLKGIDDQIKRDRLGIWRNKQRNQAIADAVRAAEAELGPEAQILVMVDKTEHGFLLQQLLPDFKFVHGEMDKADEASFVKQGIKLATQVACTPKQRAAYKKEFMEYKLKRVISTRVWRQGVDFRDLSCLVRADGLSSSIDSTQIPGRLSRLGKLTEKDHGLLIDCYDSFTGSLLWRTKNRLKTYTKLGWDISYVDGI